MVSIVSKCSQIVISVTIIVIREKNRYNIKQISITIQT